MSFPGYEGKSAFLVFFLSRRADLHVVQHLIARRFDYPPEAADTESQGRRAAGAGWRANLLHRVSRSLMGDWGVGMAIASGVGARLSASRLSSFGRDAPPPGVIAA